MLGVCLVIVFIYLGTDYLKQRGQQKALTARLSDASRALSLLPQGEADLKARLAEAQRQQIAVREDLFPSDVDTTQVIAAVLRAADEEGVEVVPLATERWVERRVEETLFNVFRVRLSVSGELEDVLALAGRLEQTQFRSLAVENLSVNRADEAGGHVSGTMDMAVYEMPREGE